MRSKIIIILALSLAAFLPTLGTGGEQAEAYCIGEGINGNIYHYVDSGWRGGEYPTYLTCDADGWYTTRGYDFNPSDGCISIQAKGAFTSWSIVTSTCSAWSPTASINENWYSGSYSSWDVQICWHSSYGVNCSGGYDIITA